MTDLLTRVIAALNAVASAVGRWLFAPVALMPGWLSATLIAVVTGILLLVVFKYTSNQRAIKRVRNDINANLLALKLFKDNASVAVHAQYRLLVGALWLFIYAIVPILVMTVPVLLLLGQISLWYQARPLPVGEESVLSLKLNGADDAPWPSVVLEPSDGIEVLTGPVRIQSQREFCWQIKAKKAGYYRLAFRVDGQTIEKELAVGNGFKRVSVKRPERKLLDVLENPSESPFGPDAPVRSIDVEYPTRDSWVSGTDSWVIYWFVVSFVAAILCRKLVKVNI